MKPLLKAHLALLAVNLIYGANYVFAKDIMPNYIQSNAMVFIRVAGATCLFWIVRFFFQEKVARKDLFKMALCAVFGVAINQLFFFNGLSKTSPINASIIMVANPIIVLVLATYLLKEKLSVLKITGVLTGAAGALWLILMSAANKTGGQSAIGDLFIFINASSYAVYLTLVKPLMKTYQPITVITIVFSFGLLYISMFPPVWKELLVVDFQAIPFYVWAEIIFVIVGVTFITYLLNIFALRIVSPSVSSSYIYLQPIFAGILAFVFSIVGWTDYSGTFTIHKLLSALLIVLGVYLISFASQKKVN